MRHVLLVAQILRLADLTVGHQRRPLVEALQRHHLGVGRDHFNTGAWLDLRVIELSRDHLWQDGGVRCAAPVNRPLPRERQMRAIH